MSPVNVNAANEIRADHASRYGQPRTETVEAGRVRDFLLAMDEPCDLDAAAAVPPLFLLSFARTRRPQPARGGAVNAGDEHEFFHPVYLGDAITTTREIIDIVEKRGSRGMMYLVETLTTYTNQHGIRVARGRQKVLRWGM